MIPPIDLTNILPKSLATTTTPIVSTNGKIYLQGTTIIKKGYILKWEWEIVNTGTFKGTTPDKKTTLISEGE